MGTTYYVSATNGNNNNPGNQADKPLRTIQAAINKTQAGDTITVRAGTYTERLHIQKPGTADAPITIAAQQGEQAIIDGANLNIAEDSALVVIQQSQDVTFKDFIIRNSSGRGILVNKSSRVLINGVTIEYCYAGGLHGMQCDDLIVDRCLIHNCARRFLAVGPERFNVALLIRNSQNVTIQNNQVFENSDEGIVISLGSKNVVVSKNVCYDNRNGQIGITSAVEVVIDSNLCYHTGRKEFLTLDGNCGPGITKSDLWRYETYGQWHTRDIRVSNNIIVGCGVGFRAGRRRGKLSRVQVMHNTIVNSTQQAFDFRMRSRSTKSYIENNLVVTNNGGELVHTLGGDGIVWRHNLWSSFPGDKAFNPSSDVIDPDSGLVNINAPIGPGKLTADPYKLTGDSPAIDRGIRHNGFILMDFWGQERGRKPDIGANEYPSSSGDDPGTDPALPPEGTRVTNGLAALYEFKEGSGSEVRDVSGVGSPLNLRILNEGRVKWSEQGLTLTEPVLISSERPASKIIDACRASNEITLEAWIQPSNTSQDGPARIVSISNSKTQRNVTLGQGMHGDLPADLYMARLRTTQTSTNGLPAVVSPAGSAANFLTQVVYTRDKHNRATLYINGQDRGVLEVGGDFSTWDSQMPFLLGDELSEDRPWLGLFKLVAVYSRSLQAVEVLHNYEANLLGNASMIAEFSILPGDEYGIVPHTVEFDSSDSFAVAGITSYMWEFGDGQVSSRQNPVNIYQAPGVYTVSLTITDAAGVTEKVTKEQLITVVETPVAPLPADYARFILVNIETSSVLAFGIQYPDLRCALSWNEEPYHMVVYSEVDDIIRIFTLGNSIELIWVDTLEEI